MKKLCNKLLICLYCILIIKRSCYIRLCSFFCVLINFVYVSNFYIDMYLYIYIYICCKLMKLYEIMLKILINFIG